MTNATATLARSITWASSKQSYLTARLLADRNLVDDCLRAYAYFRWADDMIDITLTGAPERQDFIERQKALIAALYQGETPTGLTPEEAMLADLIAHDRQPESGLRSFIKNFMSVIAFDAGRHGYIPSRQELHGYTNCLASAVMDGLQYFIGACQSYSRTRQRCLSVTGAHLTHMLRDLREDLANGLVNIPHEDLVGYAIDLSQVDSPQMRHWVHDQVGLARNCFREGYAYIESLPVLRCKLAGVWYCARFECILDSIERDGYRLRLDYPERHSARLWLEMARLALFTIWDHAFQRIRSFVLRPGHPAGIRPV